MVCFQIQSKKRKQQAYKLLQHKQQCFSVTILKHASSKIYIYIYNKEMKQFKMGLKYFSLWWPASSYDSQITTFKVVNLITK